jgi:hypothetical protein
MPALYPCLDSESLNLLRKLWLEWLDILSAGHQPPLQQILGIKKYILPITGTISYLFSSRLIFNKSGKTTRSSLLKKSVQFPNDHRKSR